MIGPERLRGVMAVFFVMGVIVTVISTVLLIVYALLSI